MRSFADLGGVWGVEGGYSLYALERYAADRAVLVDSDFTPEARRRAAAHPALTLVEGHLGDPAVVGRVDAVFLFDVLLHQVSPDWDEVIRLYGEAADCLLVFNRQLQGSRTVRLLDLGEAEYFENVPHRRDEEPYKTTFERLDETHPKHGGRYRDAQDIWQWGIAFDSLVAVADSLGFDLVHHDDHGPCPGLKSIESHGFVFRRCGLPRP